MQYSDHYGGQSMAAPLKRVLICSPETARWDKKALAAHCRELGYFHEPDFAVAQAQHGELRAVLEELGVKVLSLPSGPGLSLDAVYAHDASLITDGGAIILRMGKPAREDEPGHHAAFFRSLEIPILGKLRPPGMAESGDMVWLDFATLLIGRGYRTNSSGIEQVRALLAPRSIEVIEAPLPHAQGSASCLHLMSLMSILEEKIALVDLPCLAVETVELLEARDFKLIEIDPSERNSMACNVLALGKRRLLALAENPKTNQRLQEEGFEVHTFNGTELCQNGSGGPTCLTRPILRR